MKIKIFDPFISVAIVSNTVLFSGADSTRTIYVEVKKKEKAKKILQKDD